MPGASAVKGVFAASSAVDRLAVVLRAAQARAQSSCTRVCVRVGTDGTFSVSESGLDGSTIEQGQLEAAVSSNYPGGAVEFGTKGWPCSPGSASPRAGRFLIAGGGPGREVVVQLGGCVRCE